jgi:septum site-determining protein MinC
LEQELRRFLDPKRGKFVGLTVSLNVGHRLLNPVEVASICAFLEGAYRVKVDRLWSSIERLEEALSGVHPAPVALGAKPQRPTVSLKAPAGDALIVRRTCRTGTAIRHSGTVVVLGNVNPGAEVVAGGDIVVMGTLRGLAHAGADGDRAAVVVALSMGAAQVRIADRIAIAPVEETPGRAPLAPEMAYISGDAIVVEPYMGALPDDAGFDLEPEMEGKAGPAGHRNGRHGG